jgi:hypothetical protein
MRLAPILIALSALLAPPASAQNFERFALTPPDVKRLTEQKVQRAKALDEAKAAENPKELQTLRDLMAVAALPITDAKELAGNWRCRVVKVGGKILPLVGYPFFNCKITGSGNEAQFQKLSGSQLSAGTLLRLDAKTFVFRGVAYIYDRKPKPYGDGPETDLVGLTYRLAPDRLRLEFPAPYYESSYDVMELVRRK